MSMTRRQLVGISLAAASAAGGLVWLTSRPPASATLPTTDGGGDAPATDAALLTWTEQKPLPLTMQNPASFIIHPDGRLLVAGDCLVQELTPDGGGSRRFICKAPPRDLALLPDGGVLAAFATHVDVLAGDGAWRRWADLANDSQASGITAATGGVWVADSAKRQVWRFDTTGRACGMIGEHCEFVVPSAILAVAATADGTVWVTNPGRHRLEQFTVDAKPLATWGRAGGAIDAFFGCCNPARFTVLPDGRFITAEKGLPRVKIYSRDGTLASVVADAASFVPGQKGLVPRLDGKGRVLVLDPAKRAIRIFAPKGAA